MGQTKLARERVELVCVYRGLGDQIAFLGAARHFARAHPELEVVLTNLPPVVALYSDGLVVPGEAPRKISCHPEARHRVKQESWDLNYLGTYMKELGLPVTVAPGIELPEVPPMPGLLPQAYVCLQPYSGFAGIMTSDYYHTLVSSCQDACPEWPIIVTGRPDTPRDIEGADYRYLGEAHSVLSLVRHAALVLTPRSASAHIAAGYGVPSFVWIPDDGENWHLDYPDWPHVRIGMKEWHSEVASKLLTFIERVRKGSVTRPSSLGLVNGFWHLPGWFGESGGCPNGLLDLSSDPSDAVRARRSLAWATGLDPGPYPAYLNEGNAARFIAEDALHLCKGKGIDVGAHRWPLPGAIPIRDEPEKNAYELDTFEDDSLDFVFSSHCLEHLERPEDALSLWARKLKVGGVLLLYLPHPDMLLWHPTGPWGGDHRWTPSPAVVRGMVESAGLEIRILTECPDSYWSFRSVAVKPPSRKSNKAGRTIRVDAALSSSASGDLLRRRVYQGPTSDTSHH